MTPQRAWRMNIIYLQCQTMRMKRMAVENVTSHLHNTAALISIRTYFSKPHTQSTHLSGRNPRWCKDFHISSSRLRMGIASNYHDLYICLYRVQYTLWETLGKLELDKEILDGWVWPTVLGWTPYQQQWWARRPTQPHWWARRPTNSRCENPDNLITYSVWSLLIL